jgi:hypothetical protein
MYYETSDMEDLESFDHEVLGGMDGEGEWDHEGILEESASQDLETYVLGEAGHRDYEDFEGDQFLGDWIKKGASRLAKSAKQSGIGPSFLKDLAKQAAQVAGGAIAGPTGAKIADQVANQVLREGDFESDFEGDFETLGEGTEVLNEMQYNAAMAAETDSDREADQFLGALAGLAGPLIKSVAPSLMGGLFGGDRENGYDHEGYEQERDEFLPLLAMALPMLTPMIGKGVEAIGKMFRKHPKSRTAIRALPKIAAQTAKSLLQEAATGQPITQKKVAATMAQQTAKTLASKPALAQAIKQNRVGASRAQGRPSRQRSRTNGNGTTAGSRFYRGRPWRRGPVLGYIAVYGAPDSSHDSAEQTG